MQVDGGSSPDPAGRQKDDLRGRATHRAPGALDTRALHADSGYADELGMSPAVDMSVIFTRSSEALFHELAAVPRPVKFYARYGNPTVDRVARLVAEMAGADGALLTSSGMAAIFTTIFALTGAGDHVVVPSQAYGETLELFEELQRFGLSATYLDEMTPAKLTGALQPNTRVVYVETPTNPLLQLTDLAAVVETCRDHDCLVVVDNTVASCVNSRPLELGVDLVIESGTKSMGGHSDVVAGSVAGRKELLERIWWPQVLLGCVLSPFDAWLLQRGIRTMPLRVARQNHTALVLARALEAEPGVRDVYYPGLASHPGHQIACRQMDGYGGLLSFTVDGDFEATRRVVEALRICTYAASLGDVHTLVMHPAAGWWGRDFTPREAAHVPGNLLRISVGIEAAEDVVADLRGALRAAG